MILVDSSVWIAHLRGLVTPAVRTLTDRGASEPLLVGDLILMEVLQGARSEGQATRIERAMRAFPVVSLLDAAMAAKAARNYRSLRDRGITVRKTADIIIGTYCIEHGHALLHDDRDFEPMVRHLGLRAA